VIRLLFVVLLAGVCYFLHPFGIQTGWEGACLGAVAALAVIVFELRVRALSLRRLIGAVVGSVLGIFGAALFCLVLRTAPMLPANSSALQIFVLLLMTYVGLVVGANKGELLNPAALGTVFSGERTTRRSAKVLDTSVIIDGRIADIAEAGFIDGTMVVPEFVLRELQVVADSTDGSKRQRGRRGLDMLQRMQSNTKIDVQIVPDDFPSIREVDLKLLELAKKWEAKVVTNDFNLNKVAHLHHVDVLNINDLANALKPVVLPGEKMTVLILKEGKEMNQGVGYLDDGTMVVVDHARKLIGKAVEISVTSVLQTASGKMIFGKMEENGKGSEAVRSGPVEITR
jgi:uncharacterized protein YacL